MATSTEVVIEGLEERIAIPQGLSFTIKEGIVTVKGPLGGVAQNFNKIPVQIGVEGDSAVIRLQRARRKERAIAGTCKSIIEGMIEGVTKGYTYKMKIIYAHFPTSVKVKDKEREVHIENFYGERSPRVAKIVGDCKASVEGEDVVIKGVSKSDIGQTAANIESVTKMKRKDQRVFLDGVYLYEKNKGW